ncbi:MAG: ANTAR domain-containing response regulator [Burkholderiales bacterium]
MIDPPAMKPRVLIVDDVVERAEVVETALRSAGYVVAALVPATADLYAEVERLKPDVIIIDVDSPDRDTLEHLAVLSSSAPRPVVMFTQDDDSDKIREAVRAGVSAYIVDGLEGARVKPILDVAIARFEQFQALRRELDETGEKLAERKLIERAKGLLMKSRGLTEEEAYRALRKQAMTSNTRLADVARQVTALSDLLAG